ncbi:MAG: putative porin [Planctomycetota bacterium]
MKRPAAVLCLAVVLGCLAARADETTNAEEIRKLSQIVEEQGKIIQNLVARIAEMESKKTEADFKKKEDEKKGYSSKWTEKVKVGGGLRYRHERIAETDKPDRNRHRIKANLDVTAKVTDDIDVGLSVATGKYEPKAELEQGQDPASLNQTLTSGFSSKSVWIDLAYFDWHPSRVSGLHVIGGKMKNPFYAPGSTELIWDGDLRPEGLAVKFARKWGAFEPFGSAGGFWVRENSGALDSILWGVQAGLKFQPEESKWYARAGLGYFDFTQADGAKTFYNTSKSFGNTTSGGRYAYDFREFEPFIELGTDIGGVPVAVFADWVQNLGAPNGSNTGWLAGATVGKCKDPGSWQFRYNYRNIEKDAVVGVFTDSDFRGGGTDGKGSEVGFDYQLTKNVLAGISYFNNTLGVEGSKEYERLQIDVTFKF